MKIDTASLTQAKNFAYRLLSYRERSVKELGDRLVKKGFKKEVCDRVVDDLKKTGLLDDYRFAKAFAESRIKHRPSSLALIRLKLYLKGIAKDTVSSVISEVERGYDEYDVAYSLAAEKAKKFNKIGCAKAKRRACDYLLRRRFSKEVIYRVLSEVFGKR